MTAPAVSTRIEWRLAKVRQVVTETPRARTLILDVPGWPGHQAGQHVDIRLTAEDGYQVQRSYSIGSPPEDATLALTIERLEDGEASPYLCDVLTVGDDLELRGPIGGYFVWGVATGGPLFLVGGGSGIVPLMAMVHHRERSLARTGSSREALPARLLYSSRRWDDVIYRDQLSALAAKDPALGITHTLTRGAPEGWTGFHRRVDRPMLDEIGWPPSARPRVFVCGPTPFVEAVATALVELGHTPDRVKTERFGPTGG